MYIDAHSHWSDLRFSETKIPELLQKSQSQNISQFMLGGVDPTDWERQKQLQKKYPGKFHLCFGLHPYFVAAQTTPSCESALDELAQGLGSSSPPLGLGETGLDFRDKILELGGLDAEVAQAHQIEFFENQIQLARMYQKPLVLHIVRAHEKALQVFEMWGVPSKLGMVHAFNGSFEIAKKYIDLGLFISIGGAVTFEKNHKLQAAVEKIPLEFLLLESDSPDQAPEGWNGLNDSSSLWQIAERVGSLKKMQAREVLEISTQNFKKLFSL